MKCIRFAACVALATIAAACSGASARDRQQRGEAGATQSQVRQTPPEQLQDGGTFTWPIDSFPVNFNYHELDGTDVGTAQIDLAMLPASFTIDAEGNPIWNRDLLASAPVLQIEPRQVVTYHINPKAAWYDGTPITW